MRVSKRSLGNHKHGTSGRAPKSPQMRHALKREAEKNERKGKKPLPYSSVSDALSSEKPR